jgi:hypothetical protein
MFGRGFAATAACVAALIVSAAPGASATSWPVRSGVGDARLAGSRTLWTVGRSDGGFDLYEARSGSARRLQSFRPRVPNNAELVVLTPALAASGPTNWLQITKTTVEKDPQTGTIQPTDRFLTGRAEAPLTEFARCDQPSFPGRGGLDASKTVLAFGRCDGTVEIRDLSRATEPVVSGSNANAIRTAGRYVAWLEGPSSGGDRYAPDAVVVYDRVRRAELYRVPAAEAPPRIYSFTLDTDGTTAFSFDPDPTDARLESRVGWASPGAPSFHDLGLRATAGYTLKLVDGRLLLNRSRDRSGPSTRSDLLIGRLRGHKRVLARDPASLRLDFDGRSVLYVKRTCHARRVTRRLVSSFHEPAKAPVCK